jgi:ABC-2 type transport system ATP-binding protein
MSPQPDVALQVRNLSKVFQAGFWGRNVVACRSISFSVQRGEVFGLIGPNGAGKSTTLKLLLGFVRPTSGDGEVFGLPLGSRAARARIGYLAELPSFPMYLNGEEVLDHHARLSGVMTEGWPQRRSDLLERVGLARARTTRLGKFSKGMLQRMALAVALCADPELLVLDEPMSGLDPLGRHDVRTLIMEQRSRGRTVLFSSHVLSDVQAMCDGVALISHGSVFKCGPLHEVTGGTTRSVEIQLYGLNTQPLTGLETFGPLRRQGGLHVWDVRDPQQVNEALRAALALGAVVRSVTPQTDTLEEVMLRANQASRGEGRISP